MSETSEFIEFYHGTSRSCLESIRAEGLASPYLTTSEQAAAYYASCTAEGHGEEGRGDVLIVRLPQNLAEGLLRADYHAFEEPLCFQRERWARSDDDFFDMLRAGEEIRWPDSEADWRTSLAVTESVRFEGVVDPSWIRLSQKIQRP